MEDPMLQVVQGNRDYKRRWFKQFHKEFGMTYKDWTGWNGELPKRKPLISERNKSRIGYRRRNNLA